MQKCLRFLTSLLHVITTLLLLVFLCGCGGSGGIGNISPTTGTDSETTVRALSDSRSADFGAHFLLPEPLERYTWVSPFPADTKHYAAARPLAENLAMALDSVLIGVENPYYNPIPYTEAKRNGWLMLDDDGQPVPYNGGDNRYVCDPAAEGYAEAWAAGAIAKARESGCDYFWIDSTNEKLWWIADRGRIPAKYLADGNDCTAWQDAQYNFLAVVVAKAHAANLKVAINLGDRSWTDGPMARVAGLADAVMNEGAFFSILNNGEYETPYMCDRLIKETQAVNKKALLLTKLKQTDVNFDAKVEFALAGYLIARKPGDVFILWDEKPREQWYPRWTSWHPLMEQAQNLGQETSQPVNEGRVWMRHYKNGTVLLNPTDQTLPIPEAARVNASAPTTIQARTGMFIPRVQ